MPRRSPPYVHRTGIFNWLGRFCRSRIGVLRAAAAAILALGLAFPPGVAAAQDSAEPASGLRLMVIGDSLAAGFGLPAHEAFPTQLEKALREKGMPVTVINAGVSGDTSAGGRARLDWALADKPDAVILELGANDGLRGIDPKSTYANLAAILTTLKSRGIPAFIAGMYAPPNLGAAYGEEFRSVYSRLAKEFAVPLQDFFLDGVAAQPRLNQSDGMHPNAAGVAIVVDNMLPKLQPWLARMTSR
jgi:acyl-CoA thioesterase-1